MILKRDYTPLPPPPIIHSKPRNKEELKGIIRLRKLRLRLVILGVFYVPFGGFIMSIIPSEIVSGIIVFTYFFIMLVVGFRYAFAKCPRCNNVYGATKSWANGFTSKCLHCGLSIRKIDLKIDPK